MENTLSDALFKRESLIIFRAGGLEGRESTGETIRKVAGVSSHFITR